MRYFDIHVFLGRQDGFSVFVNIPKNILEKDRVYDEDLILEYAVKNNFLDSEDVSIVDSIDEITREEYLEIKG